MNYDQARELVNHTWHYTRMNDDRIYPIGYCTDHDGHASKQEAENCYKSYILDKHLQLDGKIDGALFKCQMCDNYSDGCVYIEGWMRYKLCDTHRTRAVVETLYDCSGTSIHS